MNARSELRSFWGVKKFDAWDRRQHGASDVQCLAVLHREQERATRLEGTKRRLESVLVDIAWLQEQHPDMEGEEEQQLLLEWQKYAKKLRALLSKRRR